jgi:hypothetical protein
VLIPLFAFLAMFLRRFVPVRSWHWLAIELLVFGLVYPCVAGLDSDRQTLYFNVSALLFMVFAAIQLAQRLNPGGEVKAEEPAAAPAAELAVPFVPGAASTS